MSVTLYWSPNSFNSWRTKIVLTEKKIPHVSKSINLFAGEHKNDEFLKLNPRHQLPTLVHGDVAVYESVAINEYLDRVFPETPLLPTNHHDLAVALIRIAEFHEKLGPKHFFGKVFFGGKKRDEIQPEIKAFLEEAAVWDKYLEGREYLANTYSLADIAVWPTFKMTQLAFNWSFGRFSNLKQWVERIDAREAVQEALAPGKETPGSFFSLKSDYHGWLEE